MLICHDFIFNLMNQDFDNWRLCSQIHNITQSAVLVSCTLKCNIGVIQKLACLRYDWLWILWILIDPNGWHMRLGCRAQVWRQIGERRSTQPHALLTNGLVCSIISVLTINISPLHNRVIPQTPSKRDETKCLILLWENFLSRAR